MAYIIDNKIQELGNDIAAKARWDDNTSGRRILADDTMEMTRTTTTTRRRNGIWQQEDEVVLRVVTLQSRGERSTRQIEQKKKLTYNTTGDSNSNKTT